MTRRSERNPYAVQEVTERYARLGYVLRQVRAGEWHVWGPDPERGDPFRARLLYGGTWQKVKERLDLLENGPWTSERKRRWQRR